MTIHRFLRSIYQLYSTFLSILLRLDCRHLLLRRGSPVSFHQTSTFQEKSMKILSRSTAHDVQTVDYIDTTASDS